MMIARFRLLLQLSCLLVLSMDMIMWVPKELACYLKHRQYFYILMCWGSNVKLCGHTMKLEVYYCIICFLIMEYQSES